MIIETAREKLTEALKQQNAVAASTLRMLISALEYRKSSQGGELSAEDELAVVKSEAKKRTEAADIFARHGEKDRVESELAELEILKQFLPEQVSEDEIRAVINEVKKDLGDDVNQGQLIGRVIAKFDKGTVDGSLVAKLINESE
jgi:uncharacterized protein YqeY